MKQLRMLGACVAAWSLFGCAGNVMTGAGGGGGLVLVGSPTVEMVYSAGFFPIVGLAPLGDPMNIRTNEQVQFQLVGYTATRQRVVLTAESWRTDDAASTFGVISGNTGLYTASSRQSPFAQTVTARYNGIDYSTNYQVKPRQARIIGSVLNRVTKLPIQGVSLYFYDVNGVFVGSVTTAFDGSFRASVPTNVARFQVVNDSLPLDVFRLMKFDSDISVVTTAPAYLSNRDASGAPIAVAVDQTGTEWRATGVSEPCLPLLSTATYLNSDYFLAKPILIVPNGDVDDMGAPIDPATLAEGCTVP